jgi:methylenetetrahydrofolate reductase (NADPH)
MRVTALWRSKPKPTVSFELFPARNDQAAVKLNQVLQKEVPILPGVMPVYTVKLLMMLTATCVATLTDRLRRSLAGLPEGDPAAVLELGIDLATEQCRGLLREGVPGVHIYSMDRSKSAVEIVRRLRQEGLL